MALSKIQAESMNLADTYAFSGTVSGAGGGKILNTYISGQWNGTINNASYMDLTNNSITLTPVSSSSKFFITIRSEGTQSNGANNGGFQVLRGTTVIGDSGCYGGTGGTRSIMPMGFNDIDSPNTASEIVYKVQWQKRNGGNLGTADYGAVGNMVIMEISA
jgi:hypothetical protein